MSLRKRGQTLIEVMVGLSMLTIGFSGIFSLLTQSLKMTATISNGTVATYLAAEGIELAHNLIYHDVFEEVAGVGSGWGACFGAGGNFYLDYTTHSCPPPSYSGQVVMSGFAREVTVTPAGSDEIAVQSTVTSPNGQTVVLQDIFYNWR